MEKFKQMMKGFFAYVWECIKGSFLAGLTYAMAGAILTMLVVQEGKPFSEQVTWSVVVIVCALAYNALLAWGYGGQNYEMLVSGNMKRMSALQFGTEYKISSHSYVKEYRAWKGFVMGAMCSLLAIIFVLIFGANQDKINSAFLEEATLSTGWGIAVVIGFFVCGWAILPFYCATMAGYIVSYYLALLIAVLPIFVYGGVYIAGAYGKRNKAIRAQEMADRAAAAQAAKPKKINYGGLPGTKPRKRK